MEFIKDYKVRTWLYGIATAVLLVLSGYGFIDAAQSANWTVLTGAVLNLGGAAATTLAATKTKPAASDVAHVIDEPTALGQPLNPEEVDVVDFDHAYEPKHAADESTEAVDYDHTVGPEDDEPGTIEIRG